MPALLATAAAPVVGASCAVIEMLGCFEDSAKPIKDWCLGGLAEYASPKHKKINYL